MQWQATYLKRITFVCAYAWIGADLDLTPLMWRSASSLSAQISRGRYVSYVIMAIKTARVQHQVAEWNRRGDHEAKDLLSEYLSHGRPILSRNGICGYYKGFIIEATRIGHSLAHRGTFRGNQMTADEISVSGGLRRWIDKMKNPALAWGILVSIV